MSVYMEKNIFAIVGIPLFPLLSLYLTFVAKCDGK